MSLIRVIMSTKNKETDKMLERMDEWFDAWKRENKNPNKRKSHIYTKLKIRFLIKKRGGENGL